MNYKGLILLLFGGVILILVMMSFVSSMYDDMLKIRLESEYVIIKVSDDETMHVKSILGYHNPNRKNVPKNFKFPVAFAQNFSTPEIKSIWMTNIMDEPKLGEEGKFIEWSGSLGDRERSNVKIEYSQKLLLRQVIYPLTSPELVRNNLINATYKVVLPYTAKNVRCSYSEFKVVERSGKVQVILEFKVFTPEQDLIVEWN